MRLLVFLTCAFSLYAQNQTNYVSYPLPEGPLPFRVSIQTAPFSLPFGVQAYVPALYKGEWLLVAGRVYGMHGFDQSSSETFPIAGQNNSAIVVNPSTGQSFYRSLSDPSSKLSQKQIDQLSVTDALSFQTLDGKTLYVIGGYGTDTRTGNKLTMSSLTAINVPKFIQWIKGSNKISAADCMRDISHPLLQVTGGVMLQAEPHKPYLLAFGQNFPGVYQDTTSNGIYTKQVRPFQIIDTGKTLSIYPYTPPKPIEVYRRRDLNIVPIIQKQGPSLASSFVALGGVFTPGDNFGAWTIPIQIYGDGSSFTENPNENPGAFAQGANSYSCPTIGLYSIKTQDMYTLLFGGISFIYSDGSGNWLADPELPFVNDVTTLRIDPQGNFIQYLMSGSFPQITPTFGTAPGPNLLFGSLSSFFPVDNLPSFTNGVINFDKLSLPLTLGYIVGGIESSAPETTSETGNVDTHASNYIFTVTLEKP